MEEESNETIRKDKKYVLTIILYRNIFSIPLLQHCGRVYTVATSLVSLAIKF